MFLSNLQVGPQIGKPLESQPVWSTDSSCPDVLIEKIVTMPLFP